MLRYSLVRTLQIVITVWGVTTVMFFVMRLAGDPSALFMNDQTTPEQAASR